MSKDTQFYSLMKNRNTPMTQHPQSRGRPNAGITLVSLRAFVAVVEKGGFGQASEHLGVSQPAVSTQIASLEQCLGLILLSRRPKLELTEPGRELFNRARIVLSRVEEIDQAMNELRQLERGQLCLGYSTPHFAMPILARYRDQFPSVSITMQMGNTTELLSLISDCRVDVGIMSLPVSLGDFHAVRLASPDLSLCLPAGHPLSQGVRIEPASILDYPIILREPGSVTRQVFERICAEAGVIVPPSLVVASGGAVIEAVRAGLGAGPIFAGTVGGDENLSVIPFGTTPPDVGVFAVSLRETLDLPTVRAFFDMLPQGALEG